MRLDMIIAFASMQGVYAAPAILRKPACCYVPRAPAGQGCPTAANTSPERILDDGGYKVALYERAVDRAPRDAEMLRDCSGAQRGPQLPDLRCIDADRASLVLAGGLRLGDALALAFQHDLALPRRHARQTDNRNTTASP